MRVAILGAGQMGAAFGSPLMRRGHEPVFWGPEWLDKPRLSALAAGEPHPDLGAALPGAPAGATTDLEEAVDEAEVCVLAVSSEGLGWVAKRAAAAAPESAPVMVFTKGLVERGREVVPVTTIVRESFGEGRPLIGVGGPVKAAELIREVPTRTVFASQSQEFAGEAARAFGTPYYLPTVTEDLTGTEVCAALKNCYAILVNLLAGRERESNLRALAFSAALGEMYDLVVAAGGRPETVAGAAGSGDLYVTCLTGRNGDFGRLLGEGNSPEKAQRMMYGATVEGLGALPPALELAREVGMEERLPLLSYLDEVLREGGVGDDEPPLSRLLAG